MRGREPGAALPAAMTSLPDGRAPAGVGFAAPDHRCRGSSAARPSARPVHSVYRHGDLHAGGCPRHASGHLDLTGT